MSRGISSKSGDFTQLVDVNLSNASKTIQIKRELGYE